MIGAPIIELKQIPSTNDYAQELISKSEVSEGTIIIAHEQTAGKGQGDNTWESEPGKNLTFTVVLHPVFLLPEQQFYLNKAISLAIIDHLGTILKYKPVHIKWPNDIYYDDKKLGGILITNIISGNNFITSIAGIGLNINQTVFNKSIPNPESLKQILNQDFDIHEYLTTLCKTLDDRYNNLREKRFPVLDNDYKNCLLGYSEWRKYRAGKKEFEGQIRGVDEFGRLEIRTRAGELLAFSHGEIDI